MSGNIVVYLFVLICAILASGVYGEKCPAYCTYNGTHIEPSDCGPINELSVYGYCCGWPNNIYCCVHYWDRVDMSLMPNITRPEDCLIDPSGAGLTTYNTLIISSMALVTLALL